MQNFRYSNLLHEKLGSQLITFKVHIFIEQGGPSGDHPTKAIERRRHRESADYLIALGFNYWANASERILILHRERVWRAGRINENRAEAMGTRPLGVCTWVLRRCCPVANLAEESAATAVAAAAAYSIFVPRVICASPSPGRLKCVATTGLWNSPLLIWRRTLQLYFSLLLLLLFLRCVVCRLASARVGRLNK